MLPGRVWRFNRFRTFAAPDGPCAAKSPLRTVHMTIWAWGRKAKHCARVIFPCGGRNRPDSPKEARAEAT